MAYAWELVLEAYPGLRHTAVRIQPLASRGFSGAQLWLVTTCAAAGPPRSFEQIRQFPEEKYVLRRWPAGHPSRERLNFIHHVLRAVHAAGLPVVPVPQPTLTGATWFEYAGHFWELTPWLSGEPDQDRPTRPARLESAFETLARFHDLAAAVATGRPAMEVGLAGPGTPQPATAATPPALAERQRLAAEWIAGGLAHLREAWRHPPAGLDEDVHKLAATIPELAGPLLPGLQGALAEAGRGAWPLLPAIRDVHREHVLFTGDRVSGLVDFGALRVDTPLVDVARLLGSLAGDDAAARAWALDAYATCRPLTSADRQLVELLDRSNVVLGALNWLRWIYLDRRSFDDWEGVRQRLEELTARLVRAEVRTIAIRNGA